VRHGQQLRLALRQPFSCGSSLALGTMPIAAAVVGDDGVAAVAVLAARNVPAERRGAAALDRRHYLHLLETDVPRVGKTPSRTVVAEDVRDLQSRTRHVSRRYFVSAKWCWKLRISSVVAVSGERCSHVPNRL